MGIDEAADHIAVRLDMLLTGKGIHRLQICAGHGFKVLLFKHAGQHVSASVMYGACRRGIGACLAVAFEDAHAEDGVEHVVMSQTFRRNFGGKIAVWQAAGQLLRTENLLAGQLVRQIEAPNWRADR